MRLKLLLILLLCQLSVHAVRFTPEAKANCQMMDKEAGTVTLIFATDSLHFGLPKDSILHVWVSGSICDLKDTADEYELKAYSEDSCFYRTFTWQQLHKPGNSGQPEFVFFVLKHDSTTANYYGYHHLKAQMDSRLIFYNSIPYTLIMMPDSSAYYTTNLDELERRGNEALEIRPLADFNLSDSVDQHRISNFRLTPGTKNLYRSYHPYYPSNPKRDTEMERLHWVGELAQKAGVRSDISLTGDLTGTAGQKVYFQGDSVEITIPDYYQAMIDSGHVLYVGQQIGATPSVAQCYYHSGDSLLARWIGEMVHFINDERHPMPMLTHCAIGADRTGMICAVFAALCGADWDAICADYSQTGNMKIQTYRHPNRLRYGLQLMTGLDPAACTAAQLTAAVRYHLVERMGVVSEDELDHAIHRLKGLSLDISETKEDVQLPVLDILGRPVQTSYEGVVIRSGKSYLHL